MRSMLICLILFVGVCVSAGSYSTTPAEALLVDKATAQPEETPALEAENPAACRDISGSWDWFTGDVKTFVADGAMSDPTGEWTGAWSCTDEGAYVLDWNNQTFVDTLQLSEDGSTLSGHNQFGMKVSGRRIVN